MIDIRPFDGLGHRDHGWLNATHHFSFSDYYDTARMGWGALRVWNDDVIGPKAGFPPHPHNDMEIITFVRTGAITHKDSLGNTGRTGAGDVQVMSAGTGVVHAEYNLEDEATTLFQIWIKPDRAGEAPGWGAREFPRGDRAGKWVIVASDNPEGDDSLPIRSDAKVLAAKLGKGDTVEYEAAAWRHLYLVSATGRIRVNGVEAQPRDGVAITEVDKVTVEALDDAEVVMVDTR
jgi:redox-sensitive bicupin YhaK (pirin superfamily)